MIGYLKKYDFLANWHMNKKIPKFISMVTDLLNGTENKMTKHLL